MRKHAENLCQPPSKADGEKSFLSAKSVVRTQLFGGLQVQKTILGSTSLGRGDD